MSVRKQCGLSRKIIAPVFFKKKIFLAVMASNCYFQFFAVVITFLGLASTGLLIFFHSIFIGNFKKKHSGTPLRVKVTNFNFYKFFSGTCFLVNRDCGEERKFFFYLRLFSLIFFTSILF